MSEKGAVSYNRGPRFAYLNAVAVPSRDNSSTLPPIGAGRSVGDRGGLTAEQRLRAERGRMMRERYAHLLLFGLALSVVVHLGIVLRMWTIRMNSAEVDSAPPARVFTADAPPMIDPQAFEDVDLPDPSPRPAGLLVDPMDPNPNLSADLASGNPDENSYGMLPTPGVGAIVGPGGPGNGIGIGSGKGGGGTSFFGVGGRGTRFAYIVDISGSMEQENRIVTALAELKRSVNALPDFTQFYVVLFSNGAIRPDFEMDGWLKATRGNKNRMSQWIDQQGPRGGTFPLEAFDIVFKLPQPPDVIFFLTDGEIPGETNDHVDVYAAGLKREIIINTIGFSSEAGKGPLEIMARKHRGVFRFVPAQGFAP